jgi:hypothetical protein
VRPRRGSEVLGGAGDGCAGRFAAFDIAAFSTCNKGGLIPQLRHGGNACSFGVVSKLEGTGFE